MSIPDDVMLAVARACCCAGECNKETCLAGLKSHHWVSKAKAAIEAAAPFLIAEAVKAERERCACIAEDCDVGVMGPYETREAIAQAIRRVK